MSQFWTLPLPVALYPQTETTLAAIVAQNFGSLSARTGGVSVDYGGSSDIASNSFSYWNPSSPTVGTWYVNGAPISPDTWPYVQASALGSAVYQAGNELAPLVYLSLGTTTYQVYTVAPNLVSLPAFMKAPAASDVVAAANRFNSTYGFIPNTQDCHNLAGDVTASVGATLPADTGSTDPTENTDGGFWRVVYRGSQANPVSNWQSLVQPGDIVRMAWTGGGQHTTTVLSVNGDGTMVVYDNADVVNGVEGIGIHTVDYDSQTIASSVTIYRLTSDNLYLQQGDDSGDTILGTPFNDEDVGGYGNDTMSGGLGNDIFQDKGGVNTIDGGGGYNVVDYSIAASQAYVTHRANGSWTVQIGTTQNDTLTNIEAVHFADRTVALRDGPHADFNNDGTSDVLLSGGATLIDWLVSNGADASYTTVGTFAGYQAAGTGDFNGDGVSDVLLAASNGTVSDLLMQNGAYQSAHDVGNLQGYTIAGTGDFNADGTSDVLLENSGGQVIDWMLQNGQYAGYNNVGVASSFGVLGTGNFNGDGTSDVLLENGSGAVIDWMMQNGAYQGYNTIGNASGYGVVGKGDFNGDGTTDILLENGQGNVIDWMMQNGQYAGYHQVGNAAGYGIVATGDYNGDGTTDVLLENASHQVIDWTMQNGTYAGYSNVGNAGSYAVRGT